MNRAWMHEGMMSLALTLARAQRTPAIVSTAFCAFTIMSTAPVPSNLVLLSDLPTCAPGSKVRFLGWYGLFVGLPCSS